MKNLSLYRWIWWFWVYLIRAGGLIFLLSPQNLPQDEAQKLHNAAIAYDVLIIFNPGGWGDVGIDQAADFSPILDGIHQTIENLGYRSTIVVYTRTFSNLFGRIAGTKQQLNSFKHNSRIQAKDIEYLVKCFPEKRFFIAGFSTGGGFTARTMERIAGLPNVFSIIVGVPGWFRTRSSAKSLVLNNSDRDPLSIGDVNTIAVTVFKAPFKWLLAKVTGRDLSLPLALQFPHHDYSWSSPEVGIPITKFLEDNFKEFHKETNKEKASF